jgi:hypothetical protein
LPSRFFGNERAAAAALLLGHGRLGPSWLPPPYVQLKELLAGLHVHAAWAERAVDAARLRQLNALLADLKGYRLRRVLAALTVAAILGAVSRNTAVAIIPFVLLSRWQLYLRPFLAVLTLLALLYFLFGQHVAADTLTAATIEGLFLVYAAWLYIRLYRFGTKLARRGAIAATATAIAAAALLITPALLAAQAGDAFTVLLGVAFMIGACDILVDFVLALIRGFRRWR